MKKTITTIALTLMASTAMADSFNLLCTMDVRYPTITEDTGVLLEGPVSSVLSKSGQVGAYKATVTADMTHESNQLVAVQVDEEKMSEHGHIQSNMILSSTINMDAILMGEIRSAELNVRNIRINCHLALID